MPLPTVIWLVFGTGLLAAWAGRFELRVSPRPALLSRSFGAYAVYLFLLFVPISVYFYVFHGDWFLLYLLDASKIPSAVALIGFLLEAAVGVGGFALGASLLRAQRDAFAVSAAALTLPLSATVAILAPDRLTRVGTYRQYTGQFGLANYGDGPLLPGTVVMSAFLLAGLTYLVLRLQTSGRRGG